MARKPVTDIAAWPALTLEGNLISPAMLAEIDSREAPEQKEADYGIRKGLTLRDEISAAFRVGQAHFDAFAKIGTPTAAATARFTRDFLRETLGFDDLTETTGAVALVAGGGRIPVVVVPRADDLDRRSAHLSAVQSRSAAYALQDRLNRDENAMWGLATNGAMLRLMRDNASLTRPTFVEADLAQIFQTEDMASFALVWLLLHRSRFGRAGTPAADCALERWRDSGARAGEAARDRLAGQVEQALRALGSGFLDANKDLREKIAAGEIPLTDWFNELLRLVYRLIFLMVAEDRSLLHAPDAAPDARSLYAEGYGLAHLRAQSARRSAWDRHTDRYEGLKIVFRALARGEPKLGLPALGGLFAPGQLPTLDVAKISNRAFLDAIYRLGWLADKAGTVPVNWQAMETEELGSVYESLLELQPQLADDGRVLQFATDVAEQKGNQRKTTGSYYTPDSLVQALLDTALDPVLDRAEAEGNDPAEALLNLTVIDPACGSGHFLLAAARRIASRVARIRAGGTPSAVDFRHALRDAARRCIHGADRNPMAVELTKVALWIETVDPGLPLGFFDAQIRCGDALLGVFDLKVLDIGIPDAAYKPLAGDDKAVAKYYAQKNKRERAELEKLRGGFEFGNRGNLAQAFTALRAMPEGTLDEIAAKAEKLKALTATGAAAWTLARACDLYVAAFLLPKTVDPQLAGPDNIPRRGAETIPTTGTLGEMLRGRTIFGPLMAASVDAAGKTQAFHWPLEFPDIFAKGGFDVVIGNPPYGAEVTQRTKEYIKFTQPHTAGAANTCADFIGLAISAMTDSGRFGLVVPKSITYSNAWQGVRELTLPRLISTIDIGQAWPNVALEMALLFCSKRREPASELRFRRFLSAPEVHVLRDTAVSLKIIPTGLSDFDQSVLRTISTQLASNRMQEFSTSRGKAFQKYAKENGNLRILAGRNIAPMRLDGPWRFIDLDDIEEPNILPTGSVVFQNIVAHLMNPTDHIRLIGSVTNEPMVPLDTVNVVFHPAAYPPTCVAAYLMSNFICWFVYVCGFNRAVRTMHFDNYIFEKLPATPDGLFEDLEKVVPKAPAELTADQWQKVNRTVSQAFGIVDKASEYIDAMHSRKERQHG